MLRVLSVISLLSILPLVSKSTYIESENIVGTQSGEDGVVFRVVNGVPAQLGTIPYQVSLKARISYHQYMNFCGGSVIAENKILSAGHCFAKPGNVCEKVCKVWRLSDISKFYAVAGTLRNRATYVPDGQSSEQWRSIRKVLIPQRYWFPKQDISVAYTSQPFIYSPYVKPLPIASKHMDYGSINCLASGYGRINKRITSDILLWAKLQLIPRFMCSLIHRRSMKDFICTRSEVTNVLEGDSGGPLVCRNTGDPNDQGQGVIVGVVSGARIKKFGGYDTFFTRVTSYRRFIEHSEATTTLPVFSIVWLSFVIPNLVLSQVS